MKPRIMTMIFLLSLPLSIPKAHADNETDTYDTPSVAVSELASSGTIYGATLLTVRAFAKENGGLVELDATLSPLNPQNAVDDKYRILRIRFQPSPLPTHGRYPTITIQALFYLPTSYEKTMGIAKDHFYKIEVQDEVVNLDRN